MTQPRPGGPPVVLVVEDQPDVRLGFVFLLETHGFRIREAADGFEALGQMAREQVDVVLTDLYMPGMDGLALVSAVRGRAPPQPPIIAISGSPNLGKDAALAAAKALGADVVLMKPIPGDLLVSTIRRLIGGGPTLLTRH
jgi:CheY-like chemotaxis protein